MRDVRQIAVCLSVGNEHRGVAPAAVIAGRASGWLVR
jgi:hypothetical protein